MKTLEERGKLPLKRLVDGQKWYLAPPDYKGEKGDMFLAVLKTSGTTYDWAGLISLVGYSWGLLRHPRYDEGIYITEKKYLERFSGAGAEALAVAGPPTPLPPGKACPKCGKEESAAYWETLKQRAAKEGTPGKLFHGKDPLTTTPCYVTRIDLVLLGVLPDPYVKHRAEPKGIPREPNGLSSRLAMPTPYVSLCEIQHEDYV